MPSKKLKELRDKKNLSQLEMADKLFMSQSAYSKLENGQTSLKIDILIKLLEGFGSEATELFELKKFKIVTIEDWELNNSKSTISMDTFYHYYKKTLDEVISKIENELTNLINENIRLKKEIEDLKKKPF